MAAIVVSLASAVVAASSCSSLFSTKLKYSVSRALRQSFTATTPSSFSSATLYRRGYLHMSHTLARANLGLTQPASIEFPKISFSAKEIDATEWKGDILAVGVTEKDMVKDEKSKFQNPILKKIDVLLGGILAEASTEEDFTGKIGQSTVLRIPGLGSKRVGLIGLGQSVSTTSAFKYFGEAVAAAAKSAKASKVAVVLASSEGFTDETKHKTASAIASGTNSHFKNIVELNLLGVVCMKVGPS